MSASSLVLAVLQRVTFGVHSSPCRSPGGGQVPARGDWWLSWPCPPRNPLDVTLDQLRTLLAVRETGSPLAAARIRAASTLRSANRSTPSTTHSSRSAEKRWWCQAGPRAGLPVHADRRGHDPDRGRHVHQLADRDHREAPPSRATVTVATTEFTVNFLAQVWPSVTAEFTRREIELNIVHVRTRDFRAQLDAKDVNLVCGSIAATPRT